MKLCKIYKWLGPSYISAVQGPRKTNDKINKKKSHLQFIDILIIFFVLLFTFMFNKFDVFRYDVGKICAISIHEIISLAITTNQKTVKNIS